MEKITVCAYKYEELEDEAKAKFVNDMYEMPLIMKMRMKTATQ